MAASTEGGAASLAAKGLDLLGTTMRAIADQGVDLSISDPEVRTLLIGAGVALGVHALWCSPAAFHLAKGGVREQALAH